MADIQRRRVLAAAGRLAAEEGVPGLTVGAILRVAGVSRRTFYELFADRDDCLLGALEDTLAQAAAAVLPAWRTPESWVARVRAAVLQLLWFLEDHRLSARLLVVQAPAGAPAVLARRAQVLAMLAQAVDEGRAESRAAAGLPASSAEGLVGGVLSILHTRLLAGEEPLSALAPQLTSMLVLPYLGAPAARRELGRSTPARDPSDRPGEDVLDPSALTDLPIRLTHRTVSVLAVIGACPGASNREVAAAAGVFDQGQISKLLRRLEGHDLIETRGGVPAMLGERNAWRLTPRGRAIVGLARGEVAVS